MSKKNLNTLVIKGTSFHVNQLLEESEFTLNSLKPVPEEVLAESKAQAAQWRIENWGSKYDIEPVDVVFKTLKTGYVAKVSFETPPSINIAVLIDYVSEQNPDLEFKYSFADFKTNESTQILWEMGERSQEDFADCSRSALADFDLIEAQDEEEELEDEESGLLLDLNENFDEEDDDR